MSFKLYMQTFASLNLDDCNNFPLLMIERSELTRLAFYYDSNVVKKLRYLTQSKRLINFSTYILNRKNNTLQIKRSWKGRNVHILV